MGRSDGFDEAEVLRQLAEGEETAFRQVYNRYWKNVYRAADRFLQSQDLAEDVVQEVFSALWYKRTEFLHIKNLESYLVVMARNLTFKEMKKWAAETKNNEEYLYSTDLTIDNIDDTLLSKQYEALLAEAIELLPPQQKKVFQLVKNEELSHEAVAQRLNISQGTVKNHMVRALLFIRQYLAPYVGSYLFFLMVFDRNIASYV